MGDNREKEKKKRGLDNLISNKIDSLVNVIIIMEVNAKRLMLFVTYIEEQVPDYADIYR